jgi:hypothetical protein
VKAEITGKIQPIDLLHRSRHTAGSFLAAGWPGGHPSSLRQMPYVASPPPRLYLSSREGGPTSGWRGRARATES